MEKHRLIIDLSSIARACHHAGVDHEFGFKVKFEDKDVWVNSARHMQELFMVSYGNMLRTTGTQPFQTILAKDGKDSRRLRKLLYPEYKGKRPARAPEMLMEYNKGLDMICESIKAVGGTTMEQSGMEADDLIAYLSTELEGRKTIWSRDGDMLALRSPTVDVWLNDTFNPEIHECAPAQYVLLYKALVGDTSDNLPGAHGFGKGKFKDFCLKYGADGCDALLECLDKRLIHKLAEDGDVEDFKPLQKVVDSANDVYASYACAKFYPNRINLPSNPIDIQTGKVELARFTHHTLASFGGTKTLITADNLIAAMEWIPAQIAMSPFVALDIETSVTDEGQAWCDKIDAIKANKKSGTVDVFGAVLTGLSITFGPNLQHTIYMPVDHKDTANLTTAQVKAVVDLCADKPTVIQNTSFELVVLYNTWGEWLPNVIDTVDMKSYVDENTSLGLKQSSKQYLGYEQVSYEAVTTLEGPEGTLTGGRLKGYFEKEIVSAKYVESAEPDPLTGTPTLTLVEKAVTATWERRQYRMNELPAVHVFDYACDDPICTTALFNRYEFTMEMEHTYDAFQQCEVEANYWVAQAYVDGVTVDLDVLKALEQEDDKIYDAAWAKLREHLFRLNWKGTYYEPYELTPANIKEVFEAITGQELICRARLPEKIAEAVTAQGFPELSPFILEGDEEGFNEFIQGYWEPEPEFDINKDDHMRQLMYDVLGLPIRFRTRVTDAQKKKGVKWGEGTPQADFSAVEHALQFDTVKDSPEQEVLLLIRVMNQVNTRRQFYYRPYPLYAHWKDGKIHASLGKNFTATRRFAPNGPNLNQLPKKGEGGRIRNAIVAPEGYLICAEDFSGQELRLGAEASGDEALTSCYVGDNLRDPHSLTGAGIAAREGSEFGDYSKFEEARAQGNDYVKTKREKGKSTNFSSQYLCRAPKLAKLLLVTVDEAQKFLDAKNEVYWGLAQWQQDTIVQAHAQGYVTTRLGARRHLSAKLTSIEKYVVAEAERQSVNFTIQGSGGEMTKCAVNAMWRKKLRENYGMIFLFPVHDETVKLVRIDKVYETLPLLNECMIQPYGGMKIPLESEISIGFNFGKGLVKVGKNPTREAIHAAMVKLGLEQDEEIQQVEAELLDDIVDLGALEEALNVSDVSD